MRRCTIECRVFSYLRTMLRLTSVLYIPLFDRMHFNSSIASLRGRISSQTAEFNSIYQTHHNLISRLSLVTSLSTPINIVQAPLQSSHPPSPVFCIISTTISKSVSLLKKRDAELNLSPNVEISTPLAL